MPEDLRKLRKSID
jgi:hypothetical protein